MSSVPVRADPILIPEIVPLPRGSFWMGSTDDDKFATDTERPVHRVTFHQAFGIGRYPVTAGEYRAFDSSFSETIADQLPATGVSWIDAVAYCAWLACETHRAYRLPSEAEWEYACRAGSTTPFSCGSEIPPDAANYLYSESGERVGVGALRSVGSYPANAFGLHDLHGNVCEWVADSWHPTYASAPDDGSDWQASGAEDLRVVRGGAWDYLPRLLRSAWRDALPAAMRRDNVGFRVALRFSP